MGALPSHGRGHRFNPCRAHHPNPTKSTFFDPFCFVLIGTKRHTKAELGMQISGKSVEFVRGMFPRPASAAVLGLRRFDMKLVDYLPIDAASEGQLSNLQFREALRILK